MSRRVAIWIGLAFVVAGVSGCGSSGPAMSSGVIRKCADFPDGEPFGVELERGTEGETVPPGAQSAIVCRWRARGNAIERTERVVRSKQTLTALIRTLNSLRVASQAEWEGEYSCPEEPTDDFGVGLRYPGRAEVRVSITYNGCGYVWNREGGTSFLPSKRLEVTLDRLPEEPPSS